MRLKTCDRLAYMLARYPCTLPLARTWWVVVPAGLGVAVLPLYLLTLSPGITWHNNGADSGDLASAAAVSGVAHPAGYPTYLLLARFFQTLPIGSLAYRTNLLSALSAVLAAGLSAVIVLHSVAASRRFVWAAGLAAGFGFGLSPLLWSQAVITEVYALHTLLIAAAVLILLIASDDFLAASADSWPRRARLLRLASLLIGLSLGNHLTTLLLLPIWFGLAGWHGGKVQWRTLIESVACLLVGLLVYLYIPWRAAANPPVNWGGASTPSGFWWLVSGQDYRRLIFGLPANLLMNRLQAWAGLTLAQFSWPGLLLAFYGFFFGRMRSLVPRLITVWLMVAYSIFAIGYGTSDSSAYLLPAYLALTVWFGLGLAAILQSLAGQWSGLRPIFLALVFLALFANAVRQMSTVDASRDLAADTFGLTVMARAPAHALVITTNDRDTFPLWYYHYALQKRPDLAIVVQPLLQFQWYRDSLAHTYPDLNLPPGDAPAVEDLVHLNQRPYCQTQVNLTPALVCNVAP